MKTSNRFVIAFAIFLIGRMVTPALDSAANASSGQTPDATTYQIRNVKFQDLLRPREANSANGTPIVLYPAQPWKCMTWRLQPVGDSAFHLKNLFTGKTFRADTNAPQSAVTQIPLANAGGDSPAWKFNRLADGSYEIADSHSGKALTAVKSAADDSIEIVTAAWQNLDTQKWILEKMAPKQLTM
jgi:hypothetical protein